MGSAHGRSSSVAYTELVPLEEPLVPEAPETRDAPAEAQSSADALLLAFWFNELMDAMSDVVNCVQIASSHELEAFVSVAFCVCGLSVLAMVVSVVGRSYVTRARAALTAADSRAKGDVLPEAFAYEHREEYRWTKTSELEMDLANTARRLQALRETRCVNRAIVSQLAFA